MRKNLFFLSLLAFLLVIQGLQLFRKGLFTSGWKSSVVAGIIAVSLPFDLPQASFAEPASIVIYRSGKAPEGLPISKTDSKKDIGFLRCMSNCKAQCLKPKEGLAKLDCAQDCQDQCCNSYEQCSFKIKTNVGGGF